MPVPIPTLDKLRIIPPQPATAKLQAMEFQDRQRRTGIAEDRNAIMREGQDIQRESLDLRREGFEFEKMKQNLMLGKEHLPTLQKSEYGKYRNWVKSIGAPDEFLPLEKEVEDMSEKEFADLKMKMILGSDKIAEMTLFDYKDAMVQYNDNIKRQQKLKDEDRKRRQAMEDFKAKEDYKAQKEKEKPPSSGSYDKNLLVAAQSVGINPEKVRSGQLSKEEAISVAEAYRKQFGTENLIKMLLGAGMSTDVAQEEPVIQFDENGELITGTEEPEGPTIIRNKIPAQ